MTLALEQSLYQKGFRLIAGVDEVGRGALAGPLLACAVILPDDARIEGLKDSKLCTPQQRERLAKEIRAVAIAISMVRVTPHVIDRRGLHRSNLFALRRALARLEPTPEYALTDGFPMKRPPVPCLGIKKGDRVSASIAAASIVAKVTRDRSMWLLHRRFPQYGFRKNKGYGTADHRAAIAEHGPSPVHRMSFAGMNWEPAVVDGVDVAADALAEDPTAEQEW